MRCSYESCDEEALAEVNAISFKWDEFAGERNIEAMVLEKAIVLAQNMSSLLANAIKEMQHGVVLETKAKVADKTWWFVYFDFLLYMMHIADREAAEYLNKSMRDVFMQQLLNGTMDICAEDFSDKSDVEEFRQNFKRNFNLFQQEFASYERGQTEYLTNDLFYMFAKRIQKRLGLDWDSFLNLQIFQFLIKLELILNLPDLLDDSR